MSLTVYEQSYSMQNFASNQNYFPIINCRCATVTRLFMFVVLEKTRSKPLKDDERF